MLGRIAVMTELTQELQQSLDAQRERPPRLLDPRTSEVYVLIAADQYDRVRSLLEPSEGLDDTYAAQMESAMRAGWGDPAMDDYDRYDECRDKRCP